MKEIKLYSLFKKIDPDLNHDFTFSIIEKETHYFNNIKHIKNICTKNIFFWTVNEELHHELDLPSFYLSNGLCSIYSKHGLIHRDGDQPAFLMHQEGDSYKQKYWYQNGVIHREDDKPAVVSSNKKEWYKNGKLHREEGHAFISHYVKKYYLNGKEFNREDFKKYNNIKLF